ncbi:MAG: hypothetical protein HPY46_09605 [Candidatus Aminicenantes bacterium]|uniref:Uncharacterized protein n=1 Tax=Candidatus Saccharicenans subterraneus TaxID=2508984 RepID=A0A3E2BQ80_9BACT|nr:hypothetical protein [Candidatus Aminicenantes bacterium]RFT16797.1 MAG: hypothetical protein OP8BY_1410 [Candidatus Saccharicenans subterraneum]
MSLQGTIVSCISGEVFVKQGAVKKQVRDSLKLKEIAEVETGSNSYSHIGDNPDPGSGKKSSGATLFPNSKVTVKVKRGYIEEILITQGLVWVSVSPGKPVLTPVAEFSGMAWVDVSSDGRTVVAGSRETIYNRKILRAATLDMNKQVLVTENNIGEPEPMDQRFYQAQKTWENLGVFYGTKMYQRLAEKSDDMLDAYLIPLKIISEKTGQDFEKLKEEAIRQYQKYKQWVQSEAEKYREEVEHIKKTDFSSSYTIPVNQSTEYRGIELKILSVKRDSKSNETDILSIQIEAKNISKKQVFVFWNEEARLINEEGEEFPADDYNLETSFMEESQAKGYLFIPVRKQDQNFTLQFGKKSLPKIETKLDLSKTIKGGD